jgi:hypothetical protein
MGKNFKQHLASMESGLEQINNVIANTKERIKFERAIKNKEIQIERIDFFKRGYNLAYNEINSQQKLI